MLASGTAHDDGHGAAHKREGADQMDQRPARLRLGVVLFGLPPRGLTAAVLEAARQVLRVAGFCLGNRVLFGGRLEVADVDGVLP